MSKRINIFGSSEKLLEMGDKEIKRVLSLKSPSIGINYFINNYPNVNYFCFSDSKVINRVNYQGQKIITNQFIYNMHLSKDSKYNIECIYEPNSIPESIGNSGFFAIWWAINNGFKDIYLYGVMDGDYNKRGEDTYYKHIYEEGEHHFQWNKYDKLKKIIDSNYNGRAKILRPLMK